MGTTNADSATDARDRSDMEQLAAGEDAALNRLIERHHPAVFRFLYRMLTSEAEAVDLAQETFVRVYQARSSYDPGRRFVSWLFTIAANLARNQIRWRTRHPNVSLDTSEDAGAPSLGERLPDPHASPHEAAIQAERVDAVQRAVRELPPDLREAVVLCEWEDFTVAEAAGVLETTAKGVESRLYRARRLLRERLDRWL